MRIISIHEYAIRSPDKYFLASAHFILCAFVIVRATARHVCACHTSRRFAWFDQWSVRKQMHSYLISAQSCLLMLSHCGFCFEDAASTRIFGRLIGHGSMTQLGSASRRRSARSLKTCTCWSCALVRALRSSPFANYLVRGQCQSVNGTRKIPFGRCLWRCTGVPLLFTLVPGQTSLLWSRTPFH